MNIKSGASVWRSMIGFDLIQSLQSFPGMGWSRNLPGGLGDQATFYTFQALTTYTNNNRTYLSHMTTVNRDRIQSLGAVVHVWRIGLLLPR